MSAKTSKARPKSKVKKPPEHTAMMTTLLAEHRHMATMLKVLEKQLDLIEADGNINTNVVYETLYYMTEYPDRFHHPREDAMFQRAAQLSESLADAVDTLQRDHDKMADSGKKALQAVVEWRRGKHDANKLVKTGRTYIADLFRHMEVEEKVVFPKIEATLSQWDWRELAADDTLLPAADPVFGPRVGREFRNVARSARRSLRRGVENAVILEWLGLETVLESIEVLSIARENSLFSTRKHARTTFEECREIVAQNPLLSPFQCTACSLRLYGSWVREQIEISQDTVKEMGTIRSEVRGQLRTLRNPD
ncbi:MAG: hemerythrin domain-containing protein [Halioglobus sp.]